MGAAVGIPASSLCIMRRLHSITKIQAVGLTHAEVCRTLSSSALKCAHSFVETTRVHHRLLYLYSLSHDLPGPRLVFFHVERNRFLIPRKHMLSRATVSMCSSRLGAFRLFTTPFLRFSWFTCGLLCLVSARHSFVVRFSVSVVVSTLFLTRVAVLTLMSFLRRQAQFGRFLSSNSSISASRYFRLMALACMEMICTTPLGIFLIVLNATSRPVAPWISWDDTHGNFSRIGQYPAVIWRSDKPAAMACMMTQWSCVICAFVFFIFFGFAAEARKQYTNALSRVLPTHYFRKPVSFSDEKPRCVGDSSLILELCF